MDEIFRSQARLPDILYCVAGGCAAEVGFFIDIDTGQLESCMRNNYYTAAFASHCVLKMWQEDDQKTTYPRLTPRQIVFVNSATAFLGIPGYAA